MSESTKLTFKVSSGLKNIIGRDLINNKFIAIFEIVKNSYDAGASKVKISFIENEDNSYKLIISDNGCGMSYDDIINKWLFVAYSEKKELKRKKSYRDNIKRDVAGAKGVGRFSCDRLGSKLILETHTKEDGFIHQVLMDWDTFEVDDKNLFEKIPVSYSKKEKSFDSIISGTTLIIENLR